MRNRFTRTTAALLSLSLLLVTPAPFALAETQDMPAPLLHTPVQNVQDNENMQIVVQQESFAETATGSVSFRTHPEMQMKTIPLTFTGNHTWQAEIPADVYMGDTLYYSLELTDGTETTRFPAEAATEVTVEIDAVQEVDFNQMPRLLLTELTPNSANISSKDAYEFVEIYNNSNQEINMKDYKLIYQITSTDASEDWDLTEDKIIPAQSSFVVWIKNGANDALTLTDFNANYGTAVTENQMTTISDDGLSNSGDRVLKIADDLGFIYSELSYSGTDTAVNTGITYKYPHSGSVMKKMGNSLKANPGSVLSGQVPTNAVAIVEDTEAPVIEHLAIQEIVSGDAFNFEADVTDDKQVQAVSLAYRTTSDGVWNRLPMVQQGSTSTYSVTVPEEALRTEQWFYQIEASDGVNTTTTEEYTVEIKKPTYDAQLVPPLLITEVVPDTTNVNSLDGYEFIEIYNNSNETINLADYKIRYRYPMEGPEADLIWPGEKEDIQLPSGETLVFWIINKGNTEKTTADFNAQFGVQLTENENLVKVYSDGMANGGHRGIVIATNTGIEIATSEYNNEPTVKDVAANKGILYAFPTNGSNQMVKISSATENATPGSVTALQVPTKRVQLPEDLEKPVVTDLSETASVSDQGPLEFLFDATDDTSVKTVTLYYKDNTQSTYRSVNLTQNYDDKLYHHTVYLPELIGKENISYYVTVSDGQHIVTTDVQTVTIFGEETAEGLRLNVEDGTIVTGATRISATSTPEALNNIQLAIGDTDVSAQTFQALEKQAYFSFEVKKTNLFFKNGVTMGDDILAIFDDTINTYVTMSVPLDPSKFELGKETTLSIRSGTKVSPFDTTSEENRDDFYIKNIRLVLSDGTAIYDPAYAEPEKELTIGDGGSATPTYDFSFLVPDEKFTTKAYTWDTTEGSEGPISVSASDGSTTVHSEVIVDNSAPTITPNVEDQEQRKGTFTLDAVIEDVYSGISEVTATLNGSEIQIPYETSSAVLEAGTHTLEIQATDTVGNKAVESVSFVTADEHPTKPTVLSPLPGASVSSNSATLSVQVTDPTQDALTVDFFEGHTYSPVDAEVRVVANAADTEPPAVLSVPGEMELTNDELQRINSADGEFLTTSSTEQFPYHRFDVTVDEDVTPEDIIELHWEGKSLPGRKVSMYVWNLETAKWELLEWKVAGEENFTLTSEIQGASYLDEQTVHVLIQDEIAPEASSDYTFVWMSDTQYYSESYPHIYKRMVDWIAEQKDALSIPYVFHTGDLVDVATDPQQWAYADEYMNVLEDASIPYGVLAGNHDVDHKTNDYTNYSTYFGEDRFANQPTYGGSYKDNRGHYDLISANGNDFIMVYMGWGIGEEEITWLNDVLAQYPDRMAFLAFHEYLLVSGNRSPIGNEIFEKVIVPNKNVVATLSGHYHDAETLIDSIDDDGDGSPDRTVYQMLADYQGGPEGGQGYMRLLHVNQADNSIHVKTYSPYLDDYNYYNPEQYPGKDEFTIELPLTPREKEVSTDAFEVNIFTKNKIGQTQQAINNQASVEWSNLISETLHSWYVDVKDIYGGKSRSDIWTFTTGKETTPTPNPEPTPNPTPEPEQPEQVEEVVVSPDRVQPTSTGLKVEVPAAKAIQFMIPETTLTDWKNQKKDIQFVVGGVSITVPSKVFAETTQASLVLTIMTDEADISSIQSISPLVTIRWDEFSNPRLNATPYIVSLPLQSSIQTASVKHRFGARLHETSTNWQFVRGNEQAGSWVMETKNLGTFGVFEQSKTFRDVSGHWAQKAIEELAAKLIVQGTTETTFTPEKAVTRAEFAVLLSRMLNVETTMYAGTFSDVSKSQEWAATYIEAAHRMGMIQGFQDGTFRPNQQITRQEMGAMLVRALQVEYPEALTPSNASQSFKDDKMLSSLFKEEIYLAARAGLINGRSNGSFDPLAPTTRAETSVILSRVLAK